MVCSTGATVGSGGSVAVIDCIIVVGDGIGDRFVTSADFVGGVGQR